MSATVEESIRAKLLTMTAVTTLLTAAGDTAASLVRTRMPQDVDIPANGIIVIETDGTEYENDITGTAGSAIYDISILCRSGSKKKARALSEAVRLNGTDPGTGLHGYLGTPIDVKIGMWLDNANGPNDVSRGQGADTLQWWDIDLVFTLWQTEGI